MRGRRRPAVSRLWDKGAPLDRRVLVPRTRVLVGPSDWEAEGRVAPRTVASFR